MDARMVAGIAGVVALLALAILGSVFGILYEAFWTGVIVTMGLLVGTAAITACALWGKNWPAGTKWLLTLIVFAVEALFAFQVFGLWYQWTRRWLRSSEIGRPRAISPTIMVGHWLEWG